MRTPTEIAARRGTIAEWRAIFVIQFGFFLFQKKISSSSYYLDTPQFPPQAHMLLLHIECLCEQKMLIYYAIIVSVLIFFSSLQRIMKAFREMKASVRIAVLQANE